MRRRGRVSARLCNDAIYREDWERCSPGPGCLSGMRARIPNPGRFLRILNGRGIVIPVPRRAGQIHVFLIPAATADEGVPL